MLSRAQAQERLDSYRIPDWLERRLADVAQLSPESRRAGRTLLGYDSKGKPSSDDQALEQAQMEAIQWLDKAKPSDRLQLFAALFPNLSEYVEQAWQIHLRLPYQAGWTRRTFRAPHTSSTIRWNRVYWLESLIRAVDGYQQDITWFAAWALYLSWGTADALGILFAAAIEAGSPQGEEVFEILLASAQGKHEIGAMGRHVSRALLVAARPDGWTFVEKLLLAAQRQEGLRQSILETIDEAHPEAFRRMLRLIQQHNLARFSATVRAMNIWFGFQWGAENVRAVNQTLERVLLFLDKPESRAEALNSDDGETAYLALWAIAFEDALATIEPAASLLKDLMVERRFVGAYLLTQLGLPEAQQALLPALADEDLRVAAQALLAVQRGGHETLRESDLFERLETLLPRFPRAKKILPPIVWPWLELSIEQQTVATALFNNRGNRSPKRFIPYLPIMGTWERSRVVTILAATKPDDAETRETIFSLVGDASRLVREQSLQALAGYQITETEAIRLESLLTRKVGDLRRGVLTLLLNLPNQAALASAERLLTVSNPLQRLAGLELLHQMIKGERALDQCRACAERYKSQHTQLSDAEKQLLDAILAQKREVATLNDALGLLDPAQRTKPTPPKTPKKFFLVSQKVKFITPAAIACINSLDDLIHQHRETPIIIETWQGPKEELLGNVRGSFPFPRHNTPIEEDQVRLPLPELWETWWIERSAQLRDDDGFELLRAWVLFPDMSGYYYRPDGQKDAPWLQKAFQTLFANFDKLERFQYPYTIQNILAWLVWLHPPAGAVDFLLDAVEIAFTLVPRKELARLPESEGHYYYDWDWRNNSRLLGWLELTRQYCSLCPSEWSDAHHVRFWKLLRWMDEPGPPVPRHRPYLEEVLVAFRAGGATEADILDHLLGPRPEERFYHFSHAFNDLSDLTSRKPAPLFAEYPFLAKLVNHCRERIIEVELSRGDMPTAASAPALELRLAGGLETLVRLLQAFGQENFVRGWIYDNLSKASTSSHLIRATFPTESDSPEMFATRIKAAKIPQRRLIEVAVYAPQWASHVEHALQWPQFAEAVWWMHAHTKDTGWHVDWEIREMWAAQVSERTPLSAQNLLDGAVDVAWFTRVYQALGPERWQALDNAAKYASGGGGHKRAQLFADAMLGRIEPEQLVICINQKRHQDSVRALGLLPLIKGEEGAQDLLKRYQIIQEFVRTSRQFGSQRQASEKLAATIGMENLARTAGYPDPIRLEWDMEAQAIADLAGGPITVTVDEVIVSLAINTWGEPNLTVTKQGQPLKAIPTMIKKNPKIAELQARQREVKQQAVRMRLSLEQAMCRSDIFSGSELQRLFDHPILAPMLEQLIFIGNGLTGYPIEHGQALQAHDGGVVAIQPDTSLRLAHPHDLLATQEWHLWQRDCFLAERIQPFKQVFRELYILTAVEKADGTISRRYAGHQVNPRQALALLGQRGWVNHPEEGIRRTFHDQNLSAWLTFLGGFFTPAEVEGLTIEGVRFSKRGERQPLELTQIPPRLFSEVMRDLDLIVSVAHQGGVDPEASASTIEMRTSLIRETCVMLNVANVRLQGSHALIDGQLGNYSIHLGSGVVHRQPGGALCIVPVHAQHRGRLFLPFADDDPKTAEVLSKILLLAQDTDIKDPTILEQLLGTL